MGLRSELGRTCEERGWRVPRPLLRAQGRFVRDVARRLDRDDTVLDLGAHLGAVSREFAHYAGEVHAYEPHPETFAALSRKVAGWTRIRPINAAISDRTGTARLFFDAKAGGRHTDGATLMEGKSNVADAIGTEVRAVALADVIRGIDGPVALIKMDIEGAEFRVIEALIETEEMARVGKVWVEDHCDRVPGLAEHRARVEARIAALGLTEKFDFSWP